MTCPSGYPIRSTTCGNPETPNDLPETRPQLPLMTRVTIQVHGPWPRLTAGMDNPWQPIPQGSPSWFD